MDNVDRNGYAPRAKRGGAIGVNGEFYKGGQFIANSENTTKGGSQRWEARPKSEADLARDAEIAALVARREAWLSGRVERFADLLKVLESEPQGVFETFWQSLARQIRQCGTLSPKQADYAVRALYGRCKKANQDAWWDLREALTERSE